MKKKFVFFLISIGLVTFIFLLSYAPDEYFYYLDKANYITMEAVIDFSEFSDRMDAVYLGFSQISEELTVPIDRLSFIVLLDDADQNTKAEMMESLQIGNKLTIQTAPEYFGDGYSLPIAEIRYDGNEILSFEDGYARLTYDRAVKFYRLIGILVVLLILSNTVAYFFVRKSQKRTGQTV